MPEMPEVEVLVRHLAPLLNQQVIQQVSVYRSKVIRPDSPRAFSQKAKGAEFVSLSRRGKYLLFALHQQDRAAQRLLVGHLGMTGRMYLLPAEAPLPKHTSVVLHLGRKKFVFEDTRYFGRLTFEAASIARLGHEPLGPEFTREALATALGRSRQPIKVKLLDQRIVAGLGNIYASEALFRAGVSPRAPCNRLSRAQIARLWRNIREVLREAVHCGSTVPLSYSGQGGQDRFFYFGRAAGTEDYYQERLRVYDRAGCPCGRCGAPIRRLVQAARSTFYCPHCQRR